MKKNNQKKELTVFVTVYNIAEYLPRFFRCMENQSYRDYVLLLIDDGSTDDSLRICKDYAENDNRIVIIESEHIGISAARNLVIQYIETPFMASADGDDVYEIDYLKHLMEAQKKYDADLVISRVCYRDEKYNRTGEFTRRGEMYIERQEFPKKLPMLIEDRRLNYLYGKLYRTKYFSCLRVENDVKQGSDTMFNCQYIKKIKNIVLIDDLDTNYIKYSKRSVTSYNGADAFTRICRINQFIYDSFVNTDMMTTQLQQIIDGRVLLSAIWVLDQIAMSDDKKEEKYRKASEIVEDKIYMEAYKRQKKEENLGKYPFTVIIPGEESKYIDYVIKAVLEDKRYNWRHKVVPEWVFEIYHRIKHN